MRQQHKRQNQQRVFAEVFEEKQLKRKPAQPGHDLELREVFERYESTVPKRILIFVEPSPFTYVCGYKNRFLNTVRYLQELGSKVLVITTGKRIKLPWESSDDQGAFRNPPREFQGANIAGVYSFSLPMYPSMPLSFAFSPRVFKLVREFNPDLIHCSFPGIMSLGALWYSKIIKAPLVYSYHTHVPKYMPNYGLNFLVPVFWQFIKLMFSMAALVLVTSEPLKKELQEKKMTSDQKMEVWKKAVDNDTFNPRFKSQDMRSKLTDGHPEDKVIVNIGRLGFEKNLLFLKEIQQKIPNLRVALVGDGPARKILEKEFKGTKTVFTGMLHGDELSQAYASGDIFVMPSETETLGFVVMESMASGVPVIGVRAGGIPDMISQQGVNGFLYDRGDLEQAVQQVKGLMYDE